MKVKGKEGSGTNTETVLEKKGMEGFGFFKRTVVEKRGMKLLVPVEGIK